MGILFHDLRYTLRQLRKSLGFTLTAVLTLAFGIGATTAIFSIVGGRLAAALTVSRARQAGNSRRYFGGRGGDVTGVTAPGMRIYIRDTHGFSSLGGYQQASYEFSGMGEPAQINGSRLTASIFSRAWRFAAMGRTFTQQEDDGNQQVAVVSYQMWHSRFHGDATFLGQKILLDRKPYEIIGVMPREFRVSAGSGTVEPQRALGAHELDTRRSWCRAHATGTFKWWGG